MNEHEARHLQTPEAQTQLRAAIRAGIYAALVAATRRIHDRDPGVVDHR